MITDNNTDFVYLSDLLEQKCPRLFRELTSSFGNSNIGWALLPGTKDIWAVDYMPLQIEMDKFVQFKYDPDYLKQPAYSNTRTNPGEVCQSIGIDPTEVKLVIDGGNIVKHKTQIIVTSKVFKENPRLSENAVLKALELSLEVEKVIVIPQEPDDYVGHSDGMVRFINETSVLVNAYPRDRRYREFAVNLRCALFNAGLEVVELPYTSYQNDDSGDATGCYINFLEIQNRIYVPLFGQTEDDIAVRALESTFAKHKIIEINADELAVHGGVLNCITWNILKDQN